MGQKSLLNNQDFHRYMDMAEVIFVIITADQKVFFVNKKACRVLGYKFNDIVGKNWFNHFIPKTERKMVKTVFSDLVSGIISPVEYFENAVLTRSGEVRTLEWHNSIFRDPKGAIIATLSSGNDITERKRIEEALDYRHKFERLISFISTDFVHRSSEKIDEGINTALKKIGEFVGVDRSYLFQFREGNVRMDNTHEWCRKGIKSFIHYLKDLPINYYYASREILNKAKVLEIPCVSDLPPAARREKKEFKKEGIQSLLNVPLIYGGNVIGFLGFDSVRKPKKWSKDIISLLKIVGEIFVSALERKKAELSIIQEKEKAQRYFERVQVMLMVLDLDRRVVEINQKGCEILGYKKDKIIGKDWIMNFVPERIKKEMRCIERTLREGDAQTYEHYENPVLTKSGQERLISWQNTILLDQKGAPVGLLCSGFDITEKRKAESELQQSEQRYRALVEQIPAATYVSSVDGASSALYVSPQIQDILGFSQKYCLMNPSFWKENLHPEDIQRVNDFSRESKKADNTFLCEYRMFTKDKRIVWVRDQATVLKDKEGRPLYAQGILQDITERLKTEEDLNRLRRQLEHLTRVSTMGELTAALAHELNQPLCAIQNNAEAAQQILKTKKNSKKELSEILQDIMDDDHRASQVIQRLRSLMKDKSMELNRLDINALIKEGLGFLNSDMVIKNIKINLKLGKEIGEVMGDGVQIMQVLVNLILNSSDAMMKRRRSNRMLTISTQARDSKYVQIKIKDTGLGLKKDQIKKIFQPFYTTKPNGMGMGLSISHSIIERHNGKIWAQKNSDNGMTFNFTLLRCEYYTPQEIKKRRGRK